MTTIIYLWPLWLYLGGFIAILRPVYRIVLSTDDQHHVEMGQVPDGEDRGMAFGMAILAALFWPLVLPLYGLYRLIAPTVVTRAEEHAELLRLRALARKHHLPMPDPDEDEAR